MASNDNIKSYTKPELFQQCKANPDKLYISIHENVYDVTKFADEHPGGEEVLKEHQIKDDKFIDATEAFEDVGHSMDARDLMKKYFIAKLAKQSTSQQAQNKGNTKQAGQEAKGCCAASCWYYWLIPIAIAGLSILAYKFRQ